MLIFKVQSSISVILEYFLIYRISFYFYISFFFFACAFVIFISFLILKYLYSTLIKLYIYVLVILVHQVILFQLCGKATFPISV